MSAPIVSVRGVSVLAAPWDTPNPRPSRKMVAIAVQGAPQPGTCCVPGCGQRLSSQNVQGVCRLHNHAPGHCRCMRCQRRDK